MASIKIEYPTNPIDNKTVSCDLPGVDLFYGKKHVLRIIGGTDAKSINDNYAACLAGKAVHKFENYSFPEDGPTAEEAKAYPALKTAWDEYLSIRKLTVGR